ncbi:MAG: hypothetical protein IT348_10395 [Candidatus Eisenbacteria bacterium]|nr:hypothetical protein [Candidatus Eisenbacteria bacterium]
MEKGEGSRHRSVLAGMDATRLAEILIDLLDEHVDDLDDAGLSASELMGAEVETFRDAGVLTDDAGFVVTLADGSEFQIIVIQSRR